ncbi:RNA 3 terminal phosphate [Cyclospora cayetanensis]|uniref:RNA 3 terminal phosphate n=1 Tax=Cyclospora cayetanensis TaxID=88456 RepID=A0A1D3CWU9_9EIME|nr:RNA 3 terminal phosphate [Cyclospora cayetanensis]
MTRAGKPAEGASAVPATLEYEGQMFLRERLCLSLLSGREVRIRHIREKPSAAVATAADALPGLQQMSVLLRGLTDAAASDASVDLVRLQQLPLLQSLLQLAGGEVAAAAKASPPEIKVHCRGVPGLVLVAEDLKGGCRAASDAILLDSATEAKDAAAAASRATSNRKLQVLLEAEAKATKGGAAANAGGITTAEEQLGIRVSRLLLLQQMLGGRVPPRAQKLALLFAALAADHAPSQVLLSRLVPASVGFLRLLRDFFGVAFTFTEKAQQEEVQEEHQEQESDDEEDGSMKNGPSNTADSLDLSWAPQIVASCVGIGYRNVGLSSF